MKMRPTWTKFLPPSFVINLATLGPLGFLGKAPGTNGSLAGTIFYILVFYSLSYLPYLIFSGLLVYLAVLFCGQAEILMMKHDPGEIILDEFVSIPLCFIGAHPIMDKYSVWIVIALGFLLFRFFDIVKPFGIKQFQKFKGGLGIVADDVAAALATCVSIHLGFLFWEHFL